MKTSLEHISSVKKKLVIEVEAEEVNKKIDGAYRDLRKRARIPGFRPGKVPRDILEKRFGQQVTEDVTRALINETLPKAVEETETYPLTMPLVENEALKKGQDFRYSAIMEVRPKFEVKDYLDLEVEKERCSVSDKDVDRELEEIRKNYGKLKAVEEDRGVRENDCVIIDYEGFEDDQPLDGIKSSNFLLKIGSHDFHPDFEKGLIGLKKGDTGEIKVCFDKDHYHPKLAGKTVHFKVKVTDIKVMELPELNDVFAKNLGVDFNDLNDLKTKLKEEIIQREEKRIDQELKRRLLKKISEGVEFELPESLVESEINHAITDIKQNLLRAGSNMEKAGLKEEKLREAFRPACENKVKNMLILGEIANKENLTISEVELSEGFREMALKMGQDPQIVRRYYEENQLVDSFRKKLLEEKTLSYLVKNANILEVQADKNKKEENDKPC